VLRAVSIGVVEAAIVVVQRIRKRRLRPPWGNILGGKPIERQAWMFDEIIELGDELTRQLQYIKMLRLVTHYRIVGDVDYPVKGVTAAGLAWYELAVAIASDLDDSLKIAEALPRARTAARWRSSEGRALLVLVDAMREARPGRSIRWCLQELRKRSPGLEKISLKQLDVRYHEAKKHFAATEKARKQNRRS
jgi:hypothetical protein